MDGDGDYEASSIKTLLKYRELAKNPENHPDMVNDKAMLQFLVCVLDTVDVDILELSLDTIELLCTNSCNLSAVQGTSGVVQSLKNLAANKSLSDALSDRAEKIVELLNSSLNEASGSDREKKVSRSRKVMTLHVYGLHEETRKELEDILTKKVKGIHSVMVDVEHQRCTITAYDSLDLKSLAVAVSEDSNMDVRLVSKNKFNQEILVTLADNPKEIDIQELPPYLDEKESPVNEKSVRSVKEIRIIASEWFSVAAGILQKSLYW